MGALGCDGVRGEPERARSATVGASERQEKAARGVRNRKPDIWVWSGQGAPNAGGPMDGCEL
jgi:hypothetical protein